MWTAALGGAEACVPAGGGGWYVLCSGASTVRCYVQQGGHCRAQVRVRGVQACAGHEVAGLAHYRGVSKGPDWQLPKVNRL